MQFAEAFPDEEIVATLSRQLSWSHKRAVAPSAAPSTGVLCRNVPHRGLERENAS